MPRKKTQYVDITVKGRGKVTLLLTATDKDTLYLQGGWEYKEKPGSFDIYEDEKFLEEVLGKRTKGTFTRTNGSSNLEMKDATVTLKGVDTMHGLAHGGQGTAVVRKLGSQKWMAY
jgi:hypothetical protein